jgi:competence/damage-inducible protein CinA-like protein
MMRDRGEAFTIARMSAVILSIGDELALGQTVDTNSAYLAARLAELGIVTRYHQTLADDRAAIADALTQAAQGADLLLVTGGLGPTGDDLTRQALADAMGVELKEDPVSLEAIKAFFAERGIQMSDANRVQAMLPAGAAMIQNACGTAPGIRATLQGADLFVMPGVPQEMREMYHATVLPALKRRVGVGRVILTTKVNTFGLGESVVGQMLGNLMDRDRNPTIGTTVCDAIVSVRVRSESHDAGEAKALLDATAAKVEKCLGPIVFGRNDQTLTSTLVTGLRDAGLTMATAESCTGGLIGKLVTDVPGASEVYAGGWVTYTDQLKQSQLGVSAELLQSHGAVSGPTVCAMAAGAAQRSGADLALSVSGIAGPTGGTPDKPVGTVWLGLASPAAAGTPHTRAVLVRLPGDRAAVRTRAALCALQLARLHLAHRPVTDMSWVIQTYPENRP